MGVSLRRSEHGEGPGLELGPFVGIPHTFRRRRETRGSPEHGWSASSVALLFALNKKGSLQPPLGFCVLRGSSGALLRVSSQNTDPVGGAGGAVGTNSPQLQCCPLFGLGTAGRGCYPFEEASPAATPSALLWRHRGEKKALQGLRCHLASQGPSEPRCLCVAGRGAENQQKRPWSRGPRGQRSRPEDGWRLGQLPLHGPS